MYNIVQVSLFLLIGGTQIVNAHIARAVTRTDIWLARLRHGHIHWQRVISSPIAMKFCRNFKEGLHFIAENQIFLSNSFFSNTDSHIGFFIDCSNVYLWIKSLLLAFNFIVDWYWRKLCKSHKLYTRYFLNTLHKFL